MNEVTITVNGMHCAACQALIRMELVENGFAEHIVDIRLGDHHTGEVILRNVSPEQITKAKEIINSLEGYQVND